MQQAWFRSAHSHLHAQSWQQRQATVLNEVFAFRLAAFTSIARPQPFNLCICNNTSPWCICSCGHAAVAVLRQSIILLNRSMQVCLKWNVQRGVIVIPRSQNPKNIKANVQGIFDWVLPREAKVPQPQLHRCMQYIYVALHH